MTKIKNWKSFLFEKSNYEALKYYIFDWDDNILIMETPLHIRLL